MSAFATVDIEERDPKGGRCYRPGTFRCTRHIPYCAPKHHPICRGPAPRRPAGLPDPPHGRPRPGLPRLASEPRRRARRLSGRVARSRHRHLYDRGSAAGRARLPVDARRRAGLERRAPCRGARHRAGARAVAQGGQRGLLGRPQEARLDRGVPGLAGAQARGGRARRLTPFPSVRTLL